MSNTDIAQRETFKKGYESLSPSRQQVAKGFVNVIAAALVAMVETADDEKKGSVSNCTIPPIIQCKKGGNHYGKKD